jgi:tetratricopeptide (TPR) repeat protein
VELPADEKEKNKAIERFYAYDEFCNESYRHYRKKTDGIMRRYRRYNRIAKIVGKEKVQTYLEKKIFNRHYDNFDTYISSSARFVGPSPVIPREFYDEFTDVKFEGHTFKMPKKYIEAMRYHYGETYYLLPEDKRIHAEMTHTGIPNEDYFKDYEPFIDIPKLRERRLNLKRIETEEGYRSYKWNLNYYRALIFSIELKIKKLVRENNIDLEKVLSGEDKKSRKKLFEIYGEYYHAQLHSSVRSWNIYADVDDITLETAVYILLYHCNDFNRAKKLINLRLSNGYALSERLEIYDDIVNTISEYKKFYFYGDIDNAGMMLDHGLKNYKGIKELRVSRPEYYVAAGKIQKAEEDIKKLLEHYPDNDIVLKALGDIAYINGKYKEAKKIYKHLLEASANGFYHLDIRKKLEAMGQ